MSVSVRQERRGDEAEVARVIAAAFGDRSAAEFAARIRASAGYVRERAFVAEEEGRIVGHTMLGEVALEGHARAVLILTPLAVRPGRQRAGIDSALVRVAVAAAEARGEPFVLVEGVPSFYPRLGFRSASALGLERPDERIRDAAWMALPLGSYDPELRGRIVYPEFFPPPPHA